MSHPATIQTIKEVKNHPNADKLDLIYVLGWQCVTGKGNFKVGDKCVYIEIDSVCPDKSWSQFLKDRHFRIKTIKLRGELSQGLCLPISDFPEILNKEEGEDVSEILGIIHYVKPIPENMQGLIKGNFPSFIPKTDEERIQNFPKLLESLSLMNFYVSEKEDGTSCTIFYNNGEFGVCSRNNELKKDENNLYWKMSIKYNLEEKLKEYNKNIAIQGEIVGNGIQKNRLNLEGQHLKVFNIFDIDNHKYFDFQDMIDICKELDLETVRIISTNVCFDTGVSIESLLNMAKGKYEKTNNNIEGIVIRTMEETYSEILRGRFSFKVINNEYLLKDEE